MEALVPAFIAALLTQVGQRPAMLTAILSDRYGSPLLVALGAGLAHALGNLVAAAGGALVTPMLTPEAQSMMLAVALVIGGLGNIWPVKPPRRLDDWKLGSLLTAFLGVFALSWGDATQFLTFALAVRGEPWFALAGAVAGTFAIGFIAAVLGELSWGRIPFKLFRFFVAAGMLVAGLMIGAQALRLT